MMIPATRAFSGATGRDTLETAMDDGLELSILDLVRMADDKQFSTAVTNSVRLAKIAEDSGYSRYWIAEHHEPNLSCVSPEVMIAAIASATTRIRVGSAGILLFYHSPLKVAETFRTLAALYPGRIDLGLARSRESDATIHAALLDGKPILNDSAEFAVTYASKVGQLIEHLGTSRSASEAAHEKADAEPQLWLLGSGTESAQLAARFGTRLSFFLGWRSIDAARILRDYRNGFTAGCGAHGPIASIALSGLCTDTNEEAEALRNELGFPADHPGIWGTPERCRRTIMEAAERFKVRRIVIQPLCLTFRQQERMYRLLSQALLLSAPAK